MSDQQSGLASAEVVAPSGDSSTPDSSSEEAPGLRLPPTGISFRMGIPPEIRYCRVNRNGCHELSFSMENQKHHPVRGRVDLRPLTGSNPEWLILQGHRCRDFRSRELQQYSVSIAIPLETPAGTYGFQLAGVNEANPETDFCLSESISLEWQPRKARFSRAMRRLLFVGLPLLVLALAISLWWYYVTREITPTESLETANLAASTGQWGDFYDCWTSEGQAKLLLLTASRLREHRQTHPEKYAELLDWEEMYNVSLDDQNLFPEVDFATLADDAERRITELRRRLDRADLSERQLWIDMISLGEHASGNLDHFRKQYVIHLTGKIDEAADTEDGPFQRLVRRIPAVREFDRPDAPPQKQ